ncbi:MAG: linear amide C-N hydrolase, partial [Deltaproteobacteria bacterium]
PVKLSGESLKGLGQGTGLLGLPGDYTPPSRFVRAVAFSLAAKQQDTAEQGVTMALHIINTFDIFEGIVADKKPGSKPEYDITQWITISDLKNKRIYFRTYDDLNIRYVDLHKLDFSAGKPKFIPMQGTQRFQDVSAATE